jgi:hypothetical protein
MCSQATICHGYIEDYSIVNRPLISTPSKVTTVPERSALFFNLARRIVNHGSVHYRYLLFSSRWPANQCRLIRSIGYVIESYAGE